VKPHEFEYRVVYRNRERPDAEWSVVVTRRGQGRPLRSLPAARGLITRESKSFWNRKYEYKIQYRPVTVQWHDVPRKSPAAHGERDA
jgi:hypothetical protein